MLSPLERHRRHLRSRRDICSEIANDPRRPAHQRRAAQAEAMRLSELLGGPVLPAADRLERFA